MRRQTADSAQNAASTAVETQLKAVQKDYKNFRKRAGGLFKAESDHIALGLDGEVPRDHDLFFTKLSGSYKAPAATFASIRSQIAFSRCTPSNRAISCKPVGDVTLISVK